MAKKSKKVRWNVIKALKEFETYIKEKELKFPKKDEKFDALADKLIKYFSLETVEDLAVFCAILGKDEDDTVYEYLKLSRIESIIINPIIQKLFKEGLVISTSLMGVRVTKHVLKAIGTNTIPEHKPVSFIDYVLSLYDDCECMDEECDTLLGLIDEGVAESYEVFNELGSRYKLDAMDIFIITQIFKDKSFKPYHFRTVQEFNEWSDNWYIEDACKSNFVKLHGLVELEKANGTINENTRIVFTTEAKEFFAKYGIDVWLCTDKCDNTDVIKCEDIRAKNLFYSEEVNKQISMMKNVLSEKKIKEVRETLESNGLHSGITVLLYGKPGTGKTESVYQIAKETGRDILKVDMGTMKSCWFGESEQIVRRLFKSYRNLCKKSKITPILLLNEADAIIGKRKDTNSSNVAQTENAIQDIMLDEIENLDGILIATTNIVSNFDEAFERRFLFKTEFDNPTKEAREQIWKDKMSWLTEEEVTTLAKDYGFSGGQIDNILRKSIMTEVVTGKKPTLEELIEMCKVEKLDKSNTTCSRIGFCS